jgi:hypothetical protein
VLQDGNTARERVLDWIRPSRFEYRVDRFTGPFGRIAREAIGAWEFTETGRGSAFRWTYTFRAGGRGAGALLALAVLAWARYMEQCADLCAGLARSTGDRVGRTAG